MTRTAETSLFDFDHSFARALDELATPWTAAEVPAAALLELNEPLAAELGLDPAALRAPAGVQALLGQADTASGAIAQAYAGHQFGNYSPRLGDGRALLLGEVIDVSGGRRDLHLKGSGRTPFARGGDGKAAVGPMLREYVMSEAMHALGIPTTRALAVASTGEQVVRETMLPGAVLVRVASSHLRVGTFQYAAATGDEDLLRRLADYAIERHHPDLVGGESLDSDERYLRFYERVVSAQAELVAQWMLVGFIHGVLNTDNVTIAAETIDYGPCAFMDEFDPATVFSSIDHGGRYAYGNQPQITQWNLARLGETLLPLLAEDVDAAVEAATGVLGAFPELYARAFDRGVHRKLGLGDDVADESLVDDWFRMLHEQSVDMTSAFRSLSAAVRGDAEVPRALFRDAAIFDGWAQRWRTEWSRQSLDPEAIAKGMDEVNPIYIPRNHLVEAALAAATAGDLTPFDALVEVVRNPFTERPGAERYAQSAPSDFGPHQTFCGT